MKRTWDGSKTELASLDVYIKLRRAVDSVEKRISRQQPLPKSLTVSQFAVLEALYFHGPLKQSLIASKVLTSTGNLTFVIDNLVKAGLVERTQLPADRRVRAAALTEKGLQLIEQVFPHMAAAINQSISVLDEEEKLELSRLLKILGTEQRE